MSHDNESTNVIDRPADGSDKAKTLLLVDDEPKNVRLLEALLLPHGFELLTAGSGEECLQAIDERDVDLVLLDVMMPGMNGYEVTRRIRSNPNTRLLPIVVISALRETSDRVEGIQAGCDDFISKPFDKNEVLAKIHTTLKLSHYRRQLDEKEKFEALITRISEGIVLCESDWSILRMNDHGRRFLPGASPGSDLLDAIFDTYTVSVPRDELAGSLSETSKRFLLARSRDGGSGPSYVHANLDVMADPDGNVTSLVLSMRDMTGERREEKQKEDFLNVVSHKLRGPLSAISRGLSHFRDGSTGALNKEQMAYIESMAAEANSLTGLVEKLIRFSIVNSVSVINSPSLALSTEKIKLKSYLPRLLESTVSGYGTRKVELDVTVKNETASVEISSVYFDTIISNLVENAIQFCDKETVMLDVVADKVDQEVTIAVGDNGPGIPREEKKRVFETFYQAGGKSSPHADGVGLGLPLVKRLVGAYGGDVKLTSSPSRGSIFTITFPAG
ncbi:MAG: response regulator [Candidatus Krumholzibacteriia bacterium]